MNLHEYYQHDEVLFEIVKCLRGREMVLHGYHEVNGDKRPWTFRCIKAHNLDYLRSNFNRFDFFKDAVNLNIYYSLAHLENMPMFSFKLEERKGQQEAFIGNFNKYMVGMDFGLDFDVHKQDEKTKMMLHYPIEKVLEELRYLKSELDYSKVPYQIKSSGYGFHINIEDKYFKDLKIKNIFEFYGRLSTKLANMMNFETLCGSVKGNSYDKRKFWKCPYSYDYKSNLIALPLTDKQVENFSYDMLKPEIVLEEGVKMRGLLERQGSSKGLKEFLINFELLKEGDIDATK